MTRPLHTAVTVGTFDGLHPGHLRVLDTLRAEAARRRLRPVVFTFDRHPLALIAPERAPLRLSTPAEEQAGLRALGFDVEVLAFDHALRALTADGWLRRLADVYGARLLVMGYDNTFGSDGLGMSLADYAAAAARYGIDTVRAGVVDGVSSSAVRRAVAAGDTAAAASLLGRPYAVEGTVVHGKALGRRLGFPTANLDIDPCRLLPAPGVYAARASVACPAGDSRPACPGTFPAVVNIGTRPTVDRHGALSVEAHLAGFDSDIYGCRVRLEFAARLRPEQRFDTLRQLTAAIAADVAAATALLGG